jgi:hypothetical protein
MNKMKNYLLTEDVEKIERTFPDSKISRRSWKRCFRALPMILNPDRSTHPLLRVVLTSSKSDLGLLRQSRASARDRRCQARETRV